MDIKTLIGFLTRSQNVSNVSDIYWNNVILLCKFDRDSNTFGLPLYRDYSKYQTQIREMYGSSSSSRFSMITEATRGTLPSFPTTSNITVSSYGYINNKANHQLRISELNSVPPSSYIENSLLLPDYLESVQNGNPYYSLGNGDWTIEFSFFADEVALPWKYQTIFSTGICLRHTTSAVYASTIGTYIEVDTQATSPYSGYGAFLENSELIFVANKTKHKINTTPIVKNTWYHVCIERVGNQLRTYLNTNLTYTYTFNADLTYTLAVNGDTTYNQFNIGSHGFSYLGMNFAGKPIPSTNLMDTSFSGGISNLRLTKNARYLQDFYTLSLPFNTISVSNKIDDYYNDTLYNIPLNFDLYDYGKYLAHFTDKQLLKDTLDYRTGFLYLDGVSTYTTSNISDELSPDEWTMEFYLTPFIDAEVYSGSNATIDDLFNTYQLLALTSDLMEISIPLIEIKSNNKKVIKITYEVISSASYYNIRGGYIAIKISEDGDNWLTYLSESDINWHYHVNFAWFHQPKILPNDEIKFYASYNNGDIPGLTRDITAFKSAFIEPNTHFAVELLNDVLYCLVNGVVTKTISLTNTLYQATDNLELTVGGVYDLIPGRTNVGTTYTAHSIGLGIKGVRITNHARYSTSTTNNFTYDHSLQPLALTSGVIAPARVRVLDILREVTLPSVSTQEISWIIYWNQPISGLELADFTLTQLEGISGASITELENLSDYEYRVTVDTGSGNGRLQLNFIDRHTVTYRGIATKISNAVGELNYTGEEYVINKSAPIPILTSGSNPYISGDFTVTLTFDGAISYVNQANIGIVNGILDDFVVIDDVNKIYEFTVKPIKDGVVIVQALEGTGVTDSEIYSAKSTPLTRIYAQSFIILQLPLNLASSYNDYSPDRLVLNEIIDNNTLFAASIAPLGSDSSLHVKPLLEQSGLTYDGFNAVSATLESQLDEDWTIEFFLRVNTSGNNFTHILSIENVSTGFSIVAQNGFIKVQRSVTNSTNLFGSVAITEIDTPTYVTWDSVDYNSTRKFPHFAITKKGNVFRFYKNGTRVAILESNSLIDITKGDLKLGYYENRVNDVEYYLSNVRLTLGKALYTAYQVNIPQLPYSVPLNIAEETELLNYISINSTNSQSNLAREDDEVLLKFSSIIPLTNVPTVTLLGRSVTPILKEYNNYVATTTVLDTDLDGEVTFTIDIQGQVGIPDKTFTETTNQSSVIVDNTPLTVTISTNEPNNNNYLFTCYLDFSETVNEFSNTVLTSSNCVCSNLLRLSSTRYSFIVKGLTNGNISVQLEDGKVTDLAGNTNLASNTLVRNVQVPTYIPDPYWDNVLLLIQPTSIDILDESDYLHTVTATNLSISNQTSPLGIDKSIYFSGIDSSLSFTLSQSLNAGIDYTVEFFVYINSSTVFRLAPPNSLPASNIQATTFTANWDEVDNATGYVLDVSETANFNNFVPGYKQRLVGDVDSYQISSDNLATLPIINENVLISDKGFVPKWSYPYEHLGYVYDVALDTLFTKRLYNYTDRFTTLPYSCIGNIENLTLMTETSEVTETPLESYNLQQGVILTGLLGNENYPKLLYFLEESSIRLYKDNNYSLPAIVEDVDASEWMHIAIVNSTKYTYLYVNGELQDKIRNIGFSTSYDVGYSIGRFVGYLTGLRITKGTARYSSTFNVPSLPFAKT